MADFFTKPLQGALFRKFRDQILGLAPMDSPPGVHRSVLESEQNSNGNKRTDDRRRDREKLREKISQMSTNRVTYEDRLRAIRTVRKPDGSARDGTGGPGASRGPMRTS